MAPPDGAELKRTESFQYPAGHINHLNDNQSKTLEDFKTLSKEKGYWTPATASQPASHDDETLLRYLRARKFVPTEAFKQFKETEDWRSENHLDKLYETIDVEEYDQSRRLYPQWLGRRDKRGIPVYLFEIAHLDSKALSAYQSSTDTKLQSSVQSKVPPKMLRLFALYENLCRFVLPLCSAIPNRQHPETPISQSSNIVDISGVTLMQFWKLKNHMQDASILATAHYPETLDRIFLLGAPGFFPTVWSWIKRWFDPITVSKIFVLSQKETLPTLLKFIDIENIPKKYGGKLDFKFGDLPKLDNEISTNLKWANEATAGQIPTGPVRWQYGANGDLEAVAVGSVKGVQRQQVIAGIHPDANIAQMPLSPGRVQTQSGAKTANNNPAPSKEPASAANGSAAMAPAASSAAPPVQPSSTNGNATDTTVSGVSSIPYRDNRNEAADKMSDVRQGTSATKDEQQAPTHARGNASEGTPAVARDGQGEKQAVMEPSTVGQAPKEHPLPDSGEQPTMIEQARQTAESALHSATEAGQSALAAVGLVNKKEEPAPPVKNEKHDAAIDSMEGKNVEEFLRAKTMSEPQA